MTIPLLTIAIPTYNRCEYLKQTLAVVLAQKTDEVAILVCDNCSNDGTSEYLTGLGQTVSHFRQETNVGADNNFLSCLTQATGRYVWTLCDDDFPCSNALESILDLIKTSNPSAVFVSPVPTDKDMNSYDASPVHSNWIDCNRDEFLEKVGVWFTFGSSAVVRRDALDMDFIRAQNGTALVPAAIMLSAVGKSNQVFVSSEPLIYARADNSGGYNAFLVFSRNLDHLLRRGKSFHFKRKGLTRVYNHSLSMVIVSFVSLGWRLNLTSLIVIAQYSYRYRCFYTSVIPAIAKRYIRSAKLVAKSLKRAVLEPLQTQA